MEITYRINEPTTPQQLASVFANSGIVRPVSDLERLQSMITHANLLITAWDGEVLVGVARGLTDFSYCCYLSDLAVDSQYQKHGIGRELIRLVCENITPQCTLLLLAAPNAMDYYPKIGFSAVTNGWIIKREY